MKPNNHNKIGKAAIHAMMSVFFSFAVIYSVTAQEQGLGSSSMHPLQSISNVKTAGKTILQAENVNPDAKATPLDPSINSPYEDIKPMLTPNGNRLYFSRLFHPDNTNGVNDPEDIWYTEFDRASTSWSEPVRMASHLNNAGPNYVNNVSVTGDTIILGNQYLKNGKMRAGLSYSVNVDGQWSLPLSIDIKDDYNMSAHANAFVSLRNGIIIKSIQRGESFGERDLYVSFWDGKQATEPVNMGGIINTEFEESSPFLASDNKTLYFASKGHNGYGGFDIYVTKRLDESWTNWSQPKNLGPAVNGKMNDEFFSITHCGNYAIFSRQISVHNVDIFRISMRELFNNADGIKHVQLEKPPVASM